MNIYTVSRDKELYKANAEYKNGIVLVKKGSKINRLNAPGFKPNKMVSDLRSDDSLFVNTCFLKEDVSFKSLSMAATFVTGRIANGKLVWKADNGKSVKYILGGDE